MATQYDFLLLETGSYLLLEEDGGKIIIAEREVVTPRQDCGPMWAAIQCMQTIGPMQGSSTWGGTILTGRKPWR